MDVSRISHSDYCATILDSLAYHVLLFDAHDSVDTCHQRQQSGSLEQARAMWKQPGCS